MIPAGFEPAIPTCVRPQTHALERAALGLASLIFIRTFFFHWPNTQHNTLETVSEKFCGVVLCVACCVLWQRRKVLLKISDKLDVETCQNILSHINGNAHVYTCYE